MTGELVPIPDYWVPPALLEWGQAPSSLEIIVSEDVSKEQDDSTGRSDNSTDDMTRKAWSRQTVTVFPAVGCVVDNLYTQKQELSWQTIWQEDTVRVAVKAATATAATAAADPAKQVWTVEASFGWNPEQLEADSESSTSDNSSSSSHRVSMEVTATILQDAAAAAAAAVVRSPVHVRLERQTNATVSSGGKIADGGGLDGRQVVQLLGKPLRSQSGFAATKPAVRWKAVGAEDDSSSAVRLSDRVHFPGNLTLAIGGNDDDDGNSVVLEVGHITLINDQLSIRHVVQCTLIPSTKSNNHATAREMHAVRSWTEEGTIQIV